MDEDKKQLGSAPTTPAPRLDARHAAGGCHRRGQRYRRGRRDWALPRAQEARRRRHGRRARGRGCRPRPPRRAQARARRSRHAGSTATRLLREAKAMARLEHPNVVRVYEVGSDRGRLFIAMELVDGVTLTVWLQRAPRVARGRGDVPAGRRRPRRRARRRSRAPRLQARQRARRSAAAARASPTSASRASTSASRAAS